MNLRFLSRDDVRSAFTMADAIDAMREAFGQISGYQAEIPARTTVDGEQGVLMVMAGRLTKSSAMGAKLISVFGDNAERGLPVVNALLIMVDAATGIPLAVVEGSYLTALRTGAASGLATELLARKDASVLTLFGAGVQARTQVEAIRAVRDIEEVRVVSRTRKSAEALARELKGVSVEIFEDRSAAVGGADVICTATTSRVPVFPGGAVDAGTHVNGLSSLGPDAREVEDEFVTRARILVDSVEAALEQAGDLVDPIRRNVISRADIYGELGEVVNGRLPGRTDDGQITFFKSVGNAAQDLAMGRRLMVRAARHDLGTMLEL